MASEHGDHTGSDHVAALERRSRLLLRAYAAAYRRERGEEIISTLLEATPADRTWPRPRDARALIVGGLKARATQNRSLTTGANLRVAVMVGVSLYLSVWVASYLGTMSIESQVIWRPGSGWPASPPVLTGLAVAATIALAWTAPRRVALAGALPAAAAVCYFVLVRAHITGPAIIQLASLAGLLALVPRTARPSRRWLWLLVAVMATAPLPDLQTYVGTFQPLPTTTLELVLAIGVISIICIGIDARLALAFVTYFVLTGLELAANSIILGLGLSWLFSLLLPLLIVAAVAALAVWLLRRQSAKTKTVG